MGGKTLARYSGAGHMKVLERFEAMGVIPVVTIQHEREAIPLAEALVEGGLPCAEITLRTDAALDGLRRLANKKDLLVGAGTVLTIEQARQATDAGAAFLVSPGLNPNVVRWALENQIPFFPGVSSATDIETALELGLETLKFFPAEPLGGISLIKALSKPYHMVRFLPTGGISPDNLAQYLCEPSVLACGGSWMVKGEWIREENFSRIEKETRKTVKAIQSTRKVYEADHQR